METTSSCGLCSYVPSGVEFTSEKSVTSEELCVARVRRTNIDSDTSIAHYSVMQTKIEVWKRLRSLLDG